MRVALIGIGSAGRRGHLPVLGRLQREGLLTLVAVADHHGNYRAACACDCRPARFRDGARLLESVEADLIVLASEPASHADLIALAVAHGRHILCEKPLTVTVAQHTRLAATLSSDLAFLAVHQYRYSPTWGPVARWARRAARLHLPVSISAEVHRRGTDAHAVTPWRLDRSHSGGVLADHGSHFLALAWSMAHHLKAFSARRASDPGDAETICARALAGRGEMTLLITNGAQTRHTRVKLECGAATFTWADHRATLRVAGRPVSTWLTPALSDRQHVDALYLPLYRDLLANIRNASWCQERRAEALAVNGTLVELLASADRVHA